MAPAGSPIDRATRLPLAIRFALFVAWIFVLLLGSEAVLRYATPDIEIRTPLKYGGFLQPYRPDIEADLVSADFRVRYRIDGEGFREIAPANAASKPGSRERILILGDSFSEGFGVAAHESYGARLDADPQRTVITRARMGASPMFYVVMARELDPKLRPDLVLVQLFDNDPEENRFRHLPREPDGRIGRLPEVMRPDHHYARLRQSWNGLALVQAFRRSWQRIGGEPPARLFVRPGHEVERAVEPEHGEGMFPWYERESLPAWDERFAEHATLLRQLVEELRGSETEVWWAYVPYYPEIHAGDVEASRAGNPHYQLLAELAAELEVPLIDGLTIFAAPGIDPADYYHPHDLHWNAAGHARFTEALSARLDGRPARHAKLDASEHPPP